ncbi:hypothetical protein pEaSNUABM56_00077 [Erwinia phage pEa_SNUABM_56]|uniref:Uncharacterized protein n=1 Tax=Erwinia phage pEp_SNUABM_01 TaxID=2601643 RepID=A0A5J6DBG6_9CAUD|nr:hypothetical protein HWC63_gp050 [Erwinia phage pEp_SNUABM_01]QEQ94876.1 hypothetical protein pEpSNUABM01_050 [Erwinia phage pEp_SNUABM_01]UYL85122.1 hypothetical protein pEaSNUABM56_00077 [Erwinia phage pEa_SNUABM_56]
MLATIKEIMAEAAGLPECDEIFSEKHKYVVFAHDSILDLKEWTAGDFFRVDDQVYVMGNKGQFRRANNHPANPWRVEMGMLYHENPGYHKKKIAKRNYGSWGKILEELEELNDAHEQGSKIMQLVELSDLYGAIEGYLEERFPGMKMHDLKKFSDITKRAFRSGERK